MIGNGFLEELIELPGCGVTFDLSIPLLRVAFVEPFAELRHFFRRKGLDLFFDCFQSRHNGRNKVVIPYDVNASVAPRGTSSTSSPAIVKSISSGTMISFWRIMYSDSSSSM
jgi:hypothetical protein